MAIEPVNRLVCDVCGTTEYATQAEMGGYETVTLQFNGTRGYSERGTVVKLMCSKCLAKAYAAFGLDAEGRDRLQVGEG